jgi:hypothetical protein
MEELSQQDKSRSVSESISRLRVSRFGEMSEAVMRYFCLSLLVLVTLCGCATDKEGNKLNAWQTLKSWDDSMGDTENRLAAKTYEGY